MRDRQRLARKVKRYFFSLIKYAIKIFGLSEGRVQGKPPQNAELAVAKVSPFSDSMLLRLKHTKVLANKD